MTNVIEYAAHLDSRVDRKSAILERMESFSKSHKMCQRCGKMSSVITRSFDSHGEQMHAYCEKCAKLEEAKARIRRIIDGK